jgi:hypothetical protein
MERARSGRPLRFGAAWSKRRQVAEHGNSALKQWRGIATSYGQCAVNDRAAIVVMAVLR